MIPADGTNARKPVGALAVTGELEPAQLQADFQVGTLERDLLGGLITALGAARPLDAALASITRCLAAVPGCTQARMYLYEPEASALVLCAINGSSLPSGSREMVALGEGGVGKAVLALPPSLLDRPGGADRGAWSPVGDTGREVQEEVILPVLVPQRSLVGVIAIEGKPPQALSHLQSPLQETLTLAAHLIEKIRLGEQLERRLDVLTSLSTLTHTMSSDLPIEDLLGRLAALVGQAMEAASCLALLVDQETGALVVRAASPSSPPLESPAPVLRLDRETLDGLTELGVAQRFVELSAYAQARANPLGAHGFNGLIAVPLLREKELLGLLYCYFDEKRTSRAHDQLLLQTISLHASIALSRHRLLDLLTQQYLLKGFIELLLRGTSASDESLTLHARVLGLDLQHPHCVAMVEIGGEGEKESGTRTGGTADLTLVERVETRFRAALHQDYPGSLLLVQESILTCLIDISTPAAPQLKDWLLDRYLQLAAEDGARLFIGFSNPCQCVGDYGRAFTEAAQSLQLGHTINPDGGVVHFNDIRIYSFLTNFPAPDGFRDRHQQMIESLAAYDRAHLSGRERLVDTLEAFLEEHGNVARIASRLGIHRNTVMQRLGRIHEISGVDLESEVGAGAHFDLQLALRVYKLRSSHLV